MKTRSKVFIFLSSIVMAASAFADSWTMSVHNETSKNLYYAGYLIPANTPVWLNTKTPFDRVNLIGDGVGVTGKFVDTGIDVGVDPSKLSYLYALSHLKADGKTMIKKCYQVDTPFNWNANLDVWLSDNDVALTAYLPYTSEKVHEVPSYKCNGHYAG